MNERTEKEINEIIDWAARAEASGRSNFPGMSYEEGVRAALEWVTGQSDDKPNDE